MTWPKAWFPSDVSFVCGCAWTRKPSATAGQFIKRRKKGQQGSALARCGAGLLTMAKKGWEAKGGGGSGG